MLYGQWRLTSPRSVTCRLDSLRPASSSSSSSSILVPHPRHCSFSSSPFCYYSCCSLPGPRVLPHPGPPRQHIRVPGGGAQPSTRRLVRGIPATVTYRLSCSSRTHPTLRHDTDFFFPASSCHHEPVPSSPGAAPSTALHVFPPSSFSFSPPSLLPSQP